MILSGVVLCCTSCCKEQQWNWSPACDLKVRSFTDVFCLTFVLSEWLKRQHSCKEWRLSWSQRHCSFASKYRCTAKNPDSFLLLQILSFTHPTSLVLDNKKCRRKLMLGSPDQIMQWLSSFLTIFCPSFEKIHCDYISFMSYYWSLTSLVLINVNLTTKLNKLWVQILELFKTSLWKR